MDADAGLSRPLAAGGFRWLRILRSRAVFPIVVLGLLSVAAIFAPWLTSHSPDANNLALSLGPPFWARGGSLAYPLGTDFLGRDVFSRTLFGARVSLTVAVVVTAVAGSVGTLVGLLAGYREGKLGAALMRTSDATVALPTVIIALVIAAALGASFQSVVVAISLPLWARIARVVQSATLAIKQTDFIAYARVAGLGTFAIIFRHIFPNVIGTILVVVTVQIGGIITLEASLSYLGVGIPPPSPSWGGIVADGENYLTTAWWISVFPAALIAITVLAFNLLGDWVADRFDPRLKHGTISV